MGPVMEQPMTAVTPNQATFSATSLASACMKMHSKAEDQQQERTYFARLPACPRWNGTTNQTPLETVTDPALPYHRSEQGPRLFG